MSDFLKVENLVNLILFISIFLFSFVFVTYQYDKLVYSVFSLSTFIMLKYANRKNTFFFERFFSFFLYFGLWLSFSIKILLTKYIHYLRSEKKEWFLDGIGDFKFSITTINETLSVCIVAILAIIISSFIREKILKINPKIEIPKQNNKFKNFYIKNTRYIYIVILLILTIFGILNYNFNIYTRGIENKAIPRLVYYFFGYLYLFLIPTLISILLNYELLFKKNNKSLYFFAILEPLISSASINSRNSLFYSLSYFFGIVKFKNMKKKITIKFFYNFFFLICLAFVATVLISTSISKTRSFSEQKSIKKHNYISQNILKDKNVYFNNRVVFASTGKIQFDFNGTKKRGNYFLDKIFSSYPSVLLISRLIGIEGVMAVVGTKKKKSFRLFYESFSETSEDQITFYNKIKGMNSKKCLGEEDNFRFFSLNNDHNDKDKYCLKNLSLVGIIGFLYYSGSYTFVFFSIFLISIVFSTFEKFVFQFTKNIIFTCLVSQIFAYRLMHFGYLPSDTYKIIIAAIFTTISLFLFYKTINKLYR